MRATYPVQNQYRQHIQHDQTTFDSASTRGKDRPTMFGFRVTILSTRLSPRSGSDLYCFDDIGVARTAAEIAL